MAASITANPSLMKLCPHYPRKLLNGWQFPFEVVATTTVLRPDAPAILPSSGVAWDALRVNPRGKDVPGIRLGNFLLPTSAFPRSASVEEFLRPSLVPGRETMAFINEVMARIYAEFKYAPGATDTGTPLGTGTQKLLVQVDVERM